MLKHTQRFIDIVNEVKAMIRETAIVDVQRKLTANNNFYFIDVREESEWQKGHLPKAIHLSKGVIERDIEKIIPDVNAEIILYCGGGSRSALAALNLQKMGYTNIWSMQGGFRGWLEAGFGVTT